MSSEAPSTWSADGGNYTLATLFTPSFDGYITGVKIWLDDADQDAHPFGIYEVSNTTPLVLQMFRGAPPRGGTYGVHGQFFNSWLHPQCRVTAGHFYYAAVYFGRGQYWHTASRFTAGVGIPEIFCPASGAAPFYNGAYHQSTVIQYPDTTFNANYYGIDPLFLKR